MAEAQQACDASPDYKQVDANLPTLLHHDASPTSAVKFADMSPAARGKSAAPSPYAGSQAASEFDEVRSRIEKEKSVHIEDFTARTGMSPKTCYRLVLASMSLRLLGGGWCAMVAMEYARYYVVNDINLLNILQTCTTSPQLALQAFLFPVWGVIADRLSRKKVLVAATLAQCASVCLLTFIPCVQVYIFTRFLNLVSDIGGPIRDAMLRDLFCDVEWESEGGGVTGIKSRMALIGGIASAASMVVGAALLAAGKMEVKGFLPNEYTLHKTQCLHQDHCVPLGQFSWGGGWEIDGCLRLLMIMGTAVLCIDALLVICCFPETIRPEHKRKGSLWSFIKSSWKDLGQPWNNLRVFATPQLRELIGIREIGYVVAAGGSSAYLAFYSRFEDDFDTLTMYVFSSTAMFTGWLTLTAVPRLVERHGDLKGIWIPGTAGAVLFAISLTFLNGPLGMYLTFAVFPLFAGPSFALAGVAPGLIAKQIPSDLQGTLETAKSFLMRLTQSVCLWLWMGLQVWSSRFAYPFDALPLVGTAALGLVALYFTVRQLRHDPKETIERGDALVEFYKSGYANSAWYKRHASDSGDALDSGDEEEPNAENKVSDGHQGLPGIDNHTRFLPSCSASNLSFSETLGGLEDGLCTLRQRTDSKRALRRSGSLGSATSAVSGTSSEGAAEGERARQQPRVLETVGEVPDAGRPAASEVTL